jgi:hypothetical protein
MIDRGADHDGRLFRVLRAVVTGGGWRARLWGLCGKRLGLSLAVEDKRQKISSPPSSPLVLILSSRR